jgi:glycosyltransferase involved in cell wall biosynthesis
VWETLPFAGAYRNVRTRPYRRRVLAAADLFLPTTERARLALELEGADPARIRVSAPGIDVDRFAPPARAPAGPPTILSAGRLVWEKGHQDVIRALALLRRDGVDARVEIIGRGPEEERLTRYAAELGVADHVTLRAFVPYDEMPGVYARASCLVLASMPLWSWEEQFGMVLAEAMASALPLVASTSGAIPEVAGPQAAYFAPGDWVGLAGALRDTLARPRPGTPVDPERVQRFSVRAAADRLAAAYDELLA